MVNYLLLASGIALGFFIVFLYDTWDYISNNNQHNKKD